MASPCEILIACDQLDIADDMLDMAVTEALRIEHKVQSFYCAELSVAIKPCLWS